MPKPYNPFDRSEMLYSLEGLAMRAFFLADNDEMGLADMVVNELDTTIEAYEPKCIYEKSYDELIMFVGGYNYLIAENGISVPSISLVVDDEKRRLLKDSSEYQINKVVINDGLA